MTPLTRQTQYQQQSGAAFHHWILAACLVIMLLVGTDVVSIVLWQMGLAKKIEIVLLIPIMGITLLYYRHLIRGMTASPEITLLICLTVLSITWSDFPAYSIERLVPLIVTSGFAIALGSMMSMRGLLIFLAIYFGSSMVLSMGAIMTLPQARGIPPWGDTWNGIYAHKNGLGLAAMTAMLTCYYASRQFTGRLKTVFMIGALLGVFLLIASESRTSQVIGLITMSALLISQIVPRLETIWAIGFILFAILFVGTIAFLLASPIAEPLFALIGRKPTLSERIPIWELVWPNVKERFWLGWGYLAHWNENAPHLRFYASKGELGFLPHYSHNGLLETFLNAGFIGVALLFLGLMRFFFSVFYCMRHIPQRDPFVFVFVLGMMYLFSNITESTLLSRMSSSWIFFLAYTTKMNLVARALRADARAHYELQNRTRRASQFVSKPT